jgi:hypothetical protein
VKLRCWVNPNRLYGAASLVTEDVGVCSISKVGSVWLVSAGLLRQQTDRHFSHPPCHKVSSVNSVSGAWQHSRPGRSILRRLNLQSQAGYPIGCCNNSFIIFLTVGEMVNSRMVTDKLPGPQNYGRCEPLIENISCVAGSSYLFFLLRLIGLLSDGCEKKFGWTLASLLASGCLWCGTLCSIILVQIRGGAAQYEWSRQVEGMVHVDRRKR